MNAISDPARDDRGNVKIVYILYLVSLVVFITAVVGLVMAYVYRSDASEPVSSHYRWQIRTFWLGALYSVIGLLTSVILVGWLVLLFTAVWFIIRCVKGLQWLDRGEAIPNVESWMFGD